MTLSARPRAADVLVVGAGVVGLSVAVHLRWLGASVTVLERDRVGDGTSSRGFGTVSALSRRPASYLRLMLAAQDYYPEFVDRLGCAEAYRVTGAISLIRDEAELGAWQELMIEQSLIAGHDPGEVLDVEALRELEPALGDAFPWGQYRAADAQVEPGRLLNGLNTAALRDGVQVVQGAYVEATTHVDGTWRLETPVGPFAAPAIVNAAGAWARQLGVQAGLNVPVRSVRGQIVVLAAREPVLTAAIGWSGRTDIRQAPDGRVWLGTVEEPDSWDVALRARDTAAIVERAIETLPALTASPIDEAWAALRPVPVDGLPLLGAHARADGYYVAVGHGGLSFCGVEGRGLAQHIAGNGIDPLLAPFSPNRPLPASASSAADVRPSPDLIARAGVYGMRTDATDWAKVWSIVTRHQKATATLATAVDDQPLRAITPDRR